METFFHIALIFKPDRLRIVFGMTGDKKLKAVAVPNDMNARLIGDRHDFQFRHFFNILSAHLSVAGVRNLINVVKAAEQP